MQTTTYSHQSIPPSTKPTIFSTWLRGTLSTLCFGLLASLYSVLIIAVHFVLLIVKKTPGMVAFVAFYTFLGIFGILYSVVVLSYTLLTMVSVNASFP